MEKEQNCCESSCFMESDIRDLHWKLEENTRCTKQIQASVAALQKSTSGVVSAFEAASGAFRVLEFFGKLAKPLIWVGLLASFLYGVFIGFKAHLSSIFH